jgi:hypothetical protein
MSIDPKQDGPNGGYTEEEREIVEQCKFDEYMATKDLDEDDDCDESESEEE